MTAELGIVLVFDELLTGFRVARGGARRALRHPARPDALRQGARQRLPDRRRSRGGRADGADTNPGAGGTVGYVGTFNGHAISAAAAAASLRALADGSVQARLQELTGAAAGGPGRARRAVRRRRRPRAAAAATSSRTSRPGPVEDYRSALRTSAQHYAAFARACARAPDPRRREGAPPRRALGGAHRGRRRPAPRGGGRGLRRDRGRPVSAQIPVPDAEPRATSSRSSATRPSRSTGSRSRSSAASSSRSSARAAAASRRRCG